MLIFFFSLGGGGVGAKVVLCFVSFFSRGRGAISMQMAPT